jgi:hypothetical protein
MSTMSNTIFSTGFPRLKRTLYDIGSDLMALEDLLAETGGDISDPEVMAQVDAWFESIQKDQANKVENYCHLISDLLARAEARKVEAQRMSNLAKTSANSAASLKKRLQAYMEVTKQKKIETPLYKLSIAGNGGKLPMDILEEAKSHPETVPKRYQRIKIELDTEAVAKDLEAGVKLSFAQLGERGTHLRIK